MRDLIAYLETKGREYAPFDPSRARSIFEGFRQDFWGDFHAKIIHIIGTNGKGSTGRFIALSLAKDHKILHFTSPHLFDFRERFYRNDGLVSWEDLQKAHEILINQPYMHKASYFEYATFLAFYLAKDVDMLILEAGLGGEFDSTNVVDDKISVFTQIGLDHMEFLGNTLEEIATTKLNAMGKVAFLGIQKDSKINKLALRIAMDKGSKLYEVCQYEQDPHFPDFLNQNFALASKVVKFLGARMCQKQELNLPARMQRVRENIWLDVGHNEDAARAVCRELAGQKVVLVFNAYVQKDLHSVLAVLKEIILRVEIVSISHERITPRDVLEQTLRSEGLPFCEFEGFCEDQTYLVFGSFSVVGEILEHYLES
ncbi:Mur ligase family protein [Helicobacter pametensis]|uniref:Mur ligase family protein n=1 Tax=Helicobacter pametensis TaxID=95149 RepID=UPI0004B596FE|nr:Mur ligase family protein [Helicobacter pametensis]